MIRNYSATVDRSYENSEPDVEISVRLDFGFKTFSIVFFEPGLDDSEYIRRAETVERLESDPCDWNPSKERGLWIEEEPHFVAEVMVGAGGKFRLCQKCAALPRFKKYRKREPIEYKCETALILQPPERAGPQ